MSNRKGHRKSCWVIPWSSLRKNFGYQYDGQSLRALACLFCVMLMLFVPANVVATGPAHSGESEEEYLQHLSRHPDSEQALYAYASYLFRNKRLKESKFYIDKLLKLSPSNELGHELRRKIKSEIKNTKISRSNCTN